MGSVSRRIPAAEFLDRPWRIHEFLHGFEVEDVWSVDAVGTLADFPHVVDLVASNDTSASGSRAVRWLFAIRWKLGEWFGWDDEDEGLGGRVPTLRDRLPDELRGTVDPARFAALPFTALYELPDEFAAEIANKTMHGVLHLGAVPAGEDGSVTVQLSVLVRTNGVFGRAYMAMIKPFRHAIVYPAMFRELEHRWAEDHVP